MPFFIRLPLGILLISFSTYLAVDLIRQHNKAKRQQNHDSEED